MSKSMSDVYSSMIQKQIKTASPVTPLSESKTVTPPESVIEAYRNKKTIVTNNKKIENSVIISTLNFVMEAMESNPITARREIEKLIRELKS